MIAHIYAAKAGLAVYPQDTDGGDSEGAIIVTLDADNSLCLTQRDQCITIPVDGSNELVKAIKQVAKEKS